MSMSGPVDALRFLSTLPLPARRQAGEEGLAAAVAWFPLVGGVLGALLVGVDWACARAFPRVSHFISAALILVVYALFTGGLHHDGLMDAADALWGRRSREERLRIMRDSRAGALGVTAVVLLLLVELAAIYALPVHLVGSSGRFRWAALLAFPVLGRWTMTYLCVRFSYARPEGTGAAMINGSRPRQLIVASVVAALVLAGCFVFLVRLPLMIALLGIAALAFAELMGGFCERSLGGITGDVAGAAGMLCEAMVLLILASRVPQLMVG